MKIIQFIKNRQAVARNKKLARIEKYLEAFLTRHYDKVHCGQVMIPSFMLAQKEVARLKERGLLEVAYEQIKKGVA